MANTISYAQILQNALDKQMVHESLTGWMDANAGQVKYNGGKEVKIPQLSMDGLANYDRQADSGYTKGSIKYEYKTYTMTQDRGRKFQIDSQDVDETNFVLTATTIMGEFQRTKVIPEVDAYRLSKLATTAMGVANDENVEYGYTVANSTVIAKIKKGIKTLREKCHNGTLVIMCNYDTQLAIEEAALGKLASVSFSQGGINTKVPAIDGCPIIPVPQNRLYSAIQLYDGSTSGQTTGGYIKATSGLDVNFLIMPLDLPLAVTKQDIMRIFDPETNQSANAWAMDYRRYHDLWVLESKKEGVYANIKDAKPTQSEGR